MTPNLSALQEAILAAGGHSTAQEDSLSVRARTGLRVRKASLSAAQADAFPADDPNANADRLAFVRGLLSALAPPTTVDPDALEFVEAAATLMPLIERSSYGAGRIAAGAGAPYAHTLSDELSLYFEVELDDSFHALSAAQVQRWGCTDDRVFKAAQSILFDRSWTVSLVESGEGLLRADGEDGKNAARAAILGIWAYSQIGKRAWVSMPSPGSLLVTTRGPMGFRLLQEQAQELYAVAEEPLSTQIFVSENGRLTLCPPPRF